MDEQTSKIIEQIAQKLGTTAEYLWAVLIKQAPVDATVSLVQVIATVCISVFLWRLHVKLSNPDHQLNYDDNFSSSILMGGALSVCFILLLVAFFTIPDIINGYFNPEFWAIDYITNKAG